MSRTQHLINCPISYLVEQTKTLQSHCVNRSKSLGLTGEVVLNTPSWCFKRHCTGSKPAYLNFNIWTQAQNLQLGALNIQFYKNRYAGSKPAGRIIILLLLYPPVSHAIYARIDVNPGICGTLVLLTELHIS